MRPALSVIIPTRNRVATLGRTLEAWRGHESGAPFEVVVVDDGSEDRTFEALTAAAAKDPRLRCLHQDGSGPAAARNRALASSTGEIVLFTGDDIRPGAGLVEGHVAAHAAKEAARFILGRTEWDDERPVTPVMRHITGFGGQQFRYAYLRDGQRLGFKYFYGSNLSVARQTLGATSGPFDASFRGAALEDADLGYRLMNHRQEIGYKADLLAFHDHPYDVAGFAARQRRVGLATAGLAAKHPEVAAEFGWGLVTSAIEAAGHTPRAKAGGLALDDIEVVERHLLEALSRPSEHGSGLLERLYLGLFWYFQARGIAEARVAEPDLRGVLWVLLRDALCCSLRAACRREGGAFDARSLELLALAASAIESAVGRRPFPNCLAEELGARARAWRYAMTSRR